MTGRKREQVANDEQLRRSRYGQVKRFARIVHGYPWDAAKATVVLHNDEQGRGMLRALLALGMTGPEAMRWGQNFADDVGTMILEVDQMVPWEINGRWLGDQVQMCTDMRDYFDFPHIWPAGWTQEDIENRKARRDVENKRNHRAKRHAKATEERNMEYPERVKLRGPALFKIIPVDDPVTIKELAERTARHPLFTDANGNPLSEETRRRVIRKLLVEDAALAARITTTPAKLPNGRPVMHIARRKQCEDIRTLERA